MTHSLADFFVVSQHIVDKMSDGFPLLVVLLAVSGVPVLSRVLLCLVALPAWRMKSQLVMKIRQQLNIIVTV